MKNAKTFKGRAQVGLLVMLSILPQGFFCPDSRTQNLVVPVVEIDSVQLTIGDAAGLQPVLDIHWALPEGEIADFFDLQYTFHPDSPAVLVEKDLNRETRQVAMNLPDSLAPYTLWVGLRAGRIENTGQRHHADSVAWRPFTLINGPRLLQPSTGTEMVERKVMFSIGVASDLGVTARLSLFRKDVSSWETVLDTCYPLAQCVTPHFGSQNLDQEIILSAGPEPLKRIHWCILIHEGLPTREQGPRQGLSCSHFMRGNP